MRQTLEQGLPELGMGIGLIPRLAGFAELVLERNQVMNLTAITEPKDVAALHLLDSLELAALAGLEAGRLVDVGGMPGVQITGMTVAGDENRDSFAHGESRTTENPAEGK